MCYHKIFYMQFKILSHVICILVLTFVSVGGTLSIRENTTFSTILVSKLEISGRNLTTDSKLRILRRGGKCEDFTPYSVDAGVLTGCPDLCAGVGLEFASESEIELFAVSSSTMNCIDLHYNNCEECPIEDITAFTNNTVSIVFGCLVEGWVFVNDFILIESMEGISCFSDTGVSCDFLAGDLHVVDVSGNTVFVGDVLIDNVNIELTRNIVWSLTNRLSTKTEIVRETEGLDLPVCMDANLVGLISFIDPLILRSVAILPQSVVSGKPVPVVIKWTSSSLQTNRVSLIFQNLNYVSVYKSNGLGLTQSGLYDCLTLFISLGGFEVPEKCLVSFPTVLTAVVDIYFTNPQHSNIHYVKIRCQISVNVNLFTEYIQIRQFPEFAVGRGFLEYQPRALVGALDGHFLSPGGVSVSMFDGILSFVLSGGITFQTGIVGGSILRIYAPLSLLAVECTPTNSTLIAFPTTVCGVPPLISQNEKYLSISLPNEMSRVWGPVKMNITLGKFVGEVWPPTKTIGVDLISPRGVADYTESSTVVSDLMFSVPEKFFASFVGEDVVFFSDFGVDVDILITHDSPVWISGVYIRLVAPLGVTVVFCNYRNSTCLLNECTIPVVGGASWRVSMSVNLPAYMSDSRWKISMGYATLSSKIVESELYQFSNELTIINKIKISKFDLTKPFFGKTGDVYVAIGGLMPQVKSLNVVITGGELVARVCVVKDWPLYMYTPPYEGISNLVENCEIITNTQLNVNLKIFLYKVVGGCYIFKIENVRVLSLNVSIIVYANDESNLIVQATDLVGLQVEYPVYMNNDTTPFITTSRVWLPFRENLLLITNSAQLSSSAQPPSLPNGIVWTNFTQINQTCVSGFVEILGGSYGLGLLPKLMATTRVPPLVGIYTPRIVASTNRNGTINRVFVNFHLYTGGQANATCPNGIQIDSNSPLKLPDDFDCWVNRTLVNKCIWENDHLVVSPAMDGHMEVEFSLVNTVNSPVPQNWTISCWDEVGLVMAGSAVGFLVYSEKLSLFNVTAIDSVWPESEFRVEIRFVLSNSKPAGSYSVTVQYVPIRAFSLNDCLVSRLSAGLVGACILSDNGIEFSFNSSSTLASRTEYVFVIHGLVVNEDSDNHSVWSMRFDNEASLPLDSPIFVREITISKVFYFNLNLNELNKIKIWWKISTFEYTRFRVWAGGLTSLTCEFGQPNLSTYLFFGVDYMCVFKKEYFDLILNNNTTGSQVDSWLMFSVYNIESFTKIFVESFDAENDLLDKGNIEAPKFVPKIPLLSNDTFVLGTRLAVGDTLATDVENFEVSNVCEPFLEHACVAVKSVPAFTHMHSNVQLVNHLTHYRGVDQCIESSTMLHFQNVEQPSVNVTISNFETVWTESGITGSVLIEVWLSSDFVDSVRVTIMNCEGFNFSKSTRDTSVQQAEECSILFWVVVGDEYMSVVVGETSLGNSHTFWEVTGYWQGETVWTKNVSGFRIPRKLNVSIHLQKFGAVAYTAACWNESAQLVIQALDEENDPNSVLQIIWQNEVFNVSYSGSEISLTVQTPQLPPLLPVIVNLYINETLVGSLQDDSLDLCYSLKNVGIHKQDQRSIPPNVVQTFVVSYSSPLEVKVARAVPPNGFVCVSCTCTSSCENGFNITVLTPPVTPLVNVWYITGDDVVGSQVWGFVNGFEINQLESARIVYPANALGVFGVVGFRNSAYNVTSVRVSYVHLQVVQHVSLLVQNVSLGMQGYWVHLDLKSANTQLGDRFWIELLNGNDVVDATYTLDVLAPVYGFSIVGQKLFHYFDVQSTVSFSNISSLNYSIVESSQSCAFREEFQLSVGNVRNNAQIEKVYIELPLGVSINLAWIIQDEINFGIFTKPPNFMANVSFKNSTHVLLTLVPNWWLMDGGELRISVPVIHPTTPPGFNFYILHFCINETICVQFPFSSQLGDIKSSPSLHTLHILIATIFLLYIYF